MKTNLLVRALISALTLSYFFIANPGLLEAVDFSEAPNAGKSIHDLNKPQLVLPEKKSTQIEVEQLDRPDLQSGSNVKIYIRDYQFTGQDVFSTDELKTIIKDSINRELTFYELQQRADRITNYFRQKGYLVARAYLPAQRIADGIVKIDVVVGQYDKIALNNKTVIKESILQREMGSVRSGAYIEKAALERAVWLLSDLAGAEAKVTLSPGSKTGTSDLLITLEPQQEKQGSLSIDNYGNRYTGSMQTSMSYTAENLARQGDRMLLQMNTTPGHELTTGSAFYSLPALGQGQKLGIGYSRVSYTLGEEFSPYDAEGTADVLKLSWSYAIKRSQLNNLYGEVRLEMGDIEDRFAGFVIGDKTTKAAVLSLNGDSLDQQGATSYLLSYKIGELTINNEAADAAHTGGTYGKYSLNLLRQQYLNPRAYLLLSVNGQLASKNLDSSEKMSLGGADGVRAYPQGEASGDEGYLASAELRWLLPLKNRQDESLQLAAFVDNGSVKINKHQYSGLTDDNRRTLSAVGIGALWHKTEDFALRVNYAWKLGNDRIKSANDKPGRLWVQGVKYF